MELLERFAAGDVDAFESLFREHQGEVYRWIMRIVRNTAAAEDLTVETFWRMYRAHARFDLPKEIVAPGYGASLVTWRLIICATRGTRSPCQTICQPRRGSRWRNNWRCGMRFFAR